MTKAARLAVTMGDPAGIGPEIIAKTIHHMNKDVAAKRMRFIVFGSSLALKKACLQTKIDYDSLAMQMVDVGPIEGEIHTGEISPVGGEWAYRAIERAVEKTLANEVDAIVTAPLSKEALHLAGHNFDGHTELLAHLTKMHDAVMMLAYGHMRVTHVTTHCAIADVPGRLTEKRLRRVFEVTLDALKCLGFEHPRLGVAGLNPHSGEGGIFGSEEAKAISPIIHEFQQKGHNIVGPVPGDTVFIKLNAGQFDAVVAMYHDQGHIPVKLLGFHVDPKSGEWNAIGGVNVTLGLPILRTSVDHGTAFDIAGKGIANAESMIDAVEYAVKLLEGRRKYQ